MQPEAEPSFDLSFSFFYRPLNFSSIHIERKTIVLY